MTPLKKLSRIILKIKFFFFNREKSLVTKGLAFSGLLTDNETWPIYTFPKEDPKNVGIT